MAKVKIKKNKQVKQKQNKQQQHQPRKETPGYKGGLYNPSKPLSEKNFQRAVNAATRFQIRPSLRQANRTIGELQKRQGYEEQKQFSQGQQAVGNIGAYYQKLAENEAASLASRQATGNALTTSTAQSGKDTLAAIQAAGATAEGGIQAPEGEGGQPIAARERLASMIAEQGSQAARENNALNAQAQGQSKASMDMMSQLAAASGMRGGEFTKDAVRQLQNAIGETRNQYGSEIGKARNAKLELLMQRPEIARQTLLEMRKGEREFLQANQALGLEKKKLGAEVKGKTGGIAYSNVNTKNQLKYLHAKIKAEKEKRMQELTVQGASEEKKRNEEHRFREKEIALVNEGSKGGKGEGKFMDEGYQSRKKAMSILRRQANTPKDLAYGGEFGGRHRSGKEVRKRAFDDLVANGVDPDLAKIVIKKYVRGWRTKGSKDPNGPSLGR